MSVVTCPPRRWLLCLAPPSQAYGGCRLDQVGPEPPSVSSGCACSPSPRYPECLEQVHILTPVCADTSTQGHGPRSVVHMYTLKPARQGHIPG